MKKAYTTSAEIFHQVTRRNAPDLADQLENIQENEIIVIPGAHDHVEKILESLQIPYTVGSLDNLNKYNGAHVAFVNCSRYTSGRDTVEKFVNSGGRLVTTDWALGLASSTFPDKLEKIRTTPDDVVEVQCHHPIAQRLIGMNYVQCHPKWWLEGSSDVYNINEGVVPIITSKELNEKYGSPYVAVGFTHGKGEVLHFISHFELQRTHQRTESDKGNLEDFLTKMKANKTVTMENANMAELEAAYSTLNTVAQLCSKSPLLNYGTKSVLKKG